MKTIGLKELRKDLEGYLSLGEKLIITKNGREFGVFIPKYKTVPNEEYPKSLRTGETE